MEHKNFSPLILRAPCTKQNPLKIAVFASGAGSNLGVLLDAQKASSALFRVACVVSDKEHAGALDKANQQGAPAHWVDPQKFDDRHAFEERLLEILIAHEIELVVLAGFLRLLTRTFLDKYPMRVINLHPSLLPAFSGLHAPKKAAEYPVHVAGCTVHLVDEGMDTGPILAQAPVFLTTSDTHQEAYARIQTMEHQLLPLVVQGIAKGDVKRDNRRIEWKNRPQLCLSQE